MAVGINVDKNMKPFNNVIIMNSQQLFYFNLFVGAAFVGYFLFFKGKRREPTKLNLRAQSDLKQNGSPQSAGQSSGQFANMLQDVKSKTTSMPTPQQTVIVDRKENQNPEKSLSLMFMYNGHHFEAHEILGIPQGAPLKMATEAYQKILNECSAQDYSFYETAYKAILVVKKNQRL